MGVPAGHLMALGLCTLLVLGSTSNVTAVVELPGIEPYLAEGFAEWSTERILAPLVARWPLLALGELEKRGGKGAR